MKLQIRPRGITLTKTECARLEHDLELVLARFGERIDRVLVEISDAEVEGLKVCEIEVRLKPQTVRVVHSDTDVFLATEHAAKRVARSVSRTIDIQGLVSR
jgi:ribosome-associated translation inhibitor RaiA